MKVTVREALGKRCPNAIGGGEVFCIADRCMGWRWAEPMPKQITMEHTEDCSRKQISLLSSADQCVLCGAKAVQIELPDERLGYCGAAGVTLF